nr:PREDICTED: uncharacterized protein LOC109042212 isoform X1 [Bemisia tabaci]
MENLSAPCFKYDSEITDCHLFRSEYARDLAMDASHQSKSLDYSFRDSPIREESETKSWFRKSSLSSPKPSPRSAFMDTSNRDCSKFYPRNSEITKFNKLRKDTAKLLDSRNGDILMNSREESLEDEVCRLKKECQNLMEENKRLEQAASEDSIHTLQWQLKQTESNRQMYRAVMEQVAKFLDRVHKTFDGNQCKMNTPTKIRNRVPRSRSVHTVVTSCSSRASSPSPTHNSMCINVQRANSIAQIADTRRVPRHPPEDISPEKIAQEAFRLSRTIQSLLNTREPDLAQRLTPCSSDLTLPDSSERRDNNSVGSCSSLLQGHKSLDGSSCSTTTGDESEIISTPILETVATNHFTKTNAPVIEDESGFSSMSSFQENNSAEYRNGFCHDLRSRLPEIHAYPEIGLPLIVDPAQHHRRWSSTPVDHLYANVPQNNTSYCSNEDKMSVCWV